MSDRSNARISSRKQPKQVRSNELVSAILEAAVQVLAREGAHRFTTARVAERAGVSVGSIYQYFPNKAAILFRLQSDEWHQTTELLAKILNDDSKPPLERLRILVHAFVRSECEEAAVRVALDDAAPLYRDAPEAREARGAGDPVIGNFMSEVLPGASVSTCEFVGDLVMTTLTTVGKEFSLTHRATEEVEAYSEALADMICAYLLSLGAGELFGQGI